MATTTIKSELQDIDPEFAQELLDKNSHNRPLNRNTVDAYARIIRTGHWKVTHQGIAIDKNGALLDGQHRLAAIVATRTTVPMFLTQGLDPEDFTVIDVGRRRTPSDALDIAGVRTNRTQIAATARFLDAYDKDRFTGTHADRLDNEGIVEAVRTYGARQIEDAVRVGITHARLSGLNTTALSTFLYLVVNRHGVEWSVVEGFLDGLSSGVGLHEGDARLLLRNAALRHRAQSANGTTMRRERARRNQLLSIIKTWNAYITERRLTRLNVKDNDTMVPIVTGKESAEGEAAEDQ